MEDANDCERHILEEAARFDENERIDADERLVNDAENRHVPLAFASLNDDDRVLKRIGNIKKQKFIQQQKKPCQFVVEELMDSRERNL